MSLQVGESKELQTARNERIKRAAIDNPDVVTVEPNPNNPRFIRISARTPGRATLTLVPENGNEEVVEIFVINVIGR